MNKQTLFLIFFFSVLLSFCNGQILNSQNRQDIANYQSEILPENEMRITTDKAIKLIREKKYTDFKNLLAKEVTQKISDQQITQIVDQINLFLDKTGVPTGNDKIIPALSATVNGQDTLFINNIMYKLRPPSDEDNSDQYMLIFSFLKKYGTKKLVGVNLRQNPLTTSTKTPSIKPLQNLKFNISDITRFRIYYSEGKNRKTKFKNEIGFFAIEGNLETLEKSKLKPIIATIFSELSKSKIKKVEPFHSIINKYNVNFIQVEFVLKNKPYGLKIYLPIANGKKYENRIVVQQMEYTNLGYQYVLNQKDCPKTTTAFPKIAKMQLNDYYLEKP